MTTSEETGQKAQVTTSEIEDQKTQTMAMQEPLTTASESDIQKLFFSSSKFAVVGASKDPTKIGSRVLRWYQEREKPVTPVHPKDAVLEGYATVSSIVNLEEPSATSISIITPPKVTLGILQQAKELNVPALWIQPGAEDEAVTKYIKENELSDRVIYGGACILRLGDGIMKSML